MRIQFGRTTISYTLITTLLVAVFLLGGSARDDVWSLVILRPLSVVFLAVGIGLLGSHAMRSNRNLIGLACAFPLLALLHLLPLPPSIWQALPGRDLVTEIEGVAMLEPSWRPISLVPYRTWNSFWSFFAPLAAFALALGLTREQSRKLVFVLVIMVFASGVLGLFQTTGGVGNIFYLYRITNEGSAVGLFANRNHQAMLLAIAFPLLAAAASLSKGSREAARPKLWLAIGIGVMILPFILVTGSRAGLVVGLVGIISAAWVYRSAAPRLQPRREALKPYHYWIAISLLGSGLVLVTALVGRASALQRLFVADTMTDLRFRVWSPIADALATYFPVGTGLGTFVEVYKVVEPDENLSPQYLNHAHNDWLELVLTAGLPGGLIVAIGLFLLCRAAYGIARGARASDHLDDVLSRLGLAIIVVLALGSVYDYPLRVPSLACLFSLAVVWVLAYHGGEGLGMDREKTRRASV